ncbi:hypothetical protein NE237_021185 [Protea cynaroides]|uniref:Pentatricopeptide repeat-containing protein n=1 Tax=Protea cynaroides TaxID=273540 RepID=A0A9Q0H8M7_9MAGN|nr:hypothetical protein NE237_021185 [Protea cynaroides]
MGELLIARNLFENMPERNVVSYNSIIASYCRNDLGVEAWKFFSQMMASGLKPTQFTFGSLLSLSSLDLHQGYQSYTLILKLGLLYVDAFSGTALLGLFQRHGRLDEALKLFDDIPRRNIVTWNSLISAFSQCGFVEDSMFLFRELLRSEIRPSESSFVGILSGFGWEPDFELGEQIHGLVIKSGNLFYPSVANSVVNMYAKCSHPCLAEKMFEDVPSRDVISWNVIIGVLLRSEKPKKALELFLTMLLEGYLPNQTTFVGAIISCASLQIPTYGKLIHGKVIKINFNSDAFVGTTLIDLYAKCSTLEEAHLCFDEIYGKKLVSWNALISGYSSKYSRISVYLVREMLHLGYRPNEFSFSAVLKSSLVLEMLQFHSLIIRMGYFHNEYVLSSLITSYGTNGLVSEALRFATELTLHLPVVASNVIAGIFNRTGQYQETQKLLSCIEEPDNVSWNILISACARNGDYMDVFDLFKSMQMSKTLPDKYTFMSLLSICSKLNSLALGSAVHGFVIKNEVRCCDVFVCNVLIDMYSKCGSFGDAVKVFNEMKERNLISWTALISALGLHGYAHEALKRFREMELLGFKPDKVAFIAVLSACRHGGLVEEGMELFRCMKQMYSVEPEMDHYECIVDLLSRYGHLQEAGLLISSMPFQPNVIIWRSFLAGCNRFSNTKEQVVG